MSSPGEAGYIDYLLDSRAEELAVKYNISKEEAREESIAFDLRNE